MIQLTAVGQHGPYCRACVKWGQLDLARQTRLLHEWSLWALKHHAVALALTPRPGQVVAVARFVALRPGRREATRVMTLLCTWADCARVTLELTPSEHRGFCAQWLAQFYARYGFVANDQATNRASPASEALVRPPTDPRGSRALAAVGSGERLARTGLTATDTPPAAR